MSQYLKELFNWNVADKFNNSLQIWQLTWRFEKAMVVEYMHISVSLCPLLTQDIIRAPNHLLHVLLIVIISLKGFLKGYR